MSGLPSAADPVQLVAPNSEKFAQLGPFKCALAQIAFKFYKMVLCEKK